MKKSQRVARVFPKVTYESDYDHPIWDVEGALPTPQTAPDAFCVTSEFAPTAKELRALARKPKYHSLSRTRLRKRLSATGLRGVELAKTVAKVRSGPYAADAQQGAECYSGGIQGLGWPVLQLKAVFGKRTTRAMLKNVLTYAVFLDEMAYYMKSGFAELAQSMRSFNARPIVVTQELSEVKQLPGIGNLILALLPQPDGAVECAAQA